MALTPIAHFDVVPRQRLEAGETFNFGVVAFSKAGIADVIFTITPATGTYDGEDPKIVEVTSMSLNSRTGVWEYWVPIVADNFSADEAFTVGAVITGDDAGEKDLGTITMFANPNGTLAQYEAWVDGTSGNDGTGTVGNPALPYLTIAAAVTAAQTAGSGESGGNIIHIEEGTYTVGTASATTTSEWLTFQAASGATKANVILQDGEPTAITYLHVKGLQLESTGANGYAFDTSAANIWADDCNLIGYDRHTAGTNPIQSGGTTRYITDCYSYNCDYGVPTRCTFSRNVLVSTAGNDAFVNPTCVINCSSDDIDPGATSWHADAAQYHTGPYDNRIIYGYKATNCDYQGIFIRTEQAGLASNCALVNILIHPKPGSSLSAFYLGDSVTPAEEFDHILIWNCSFPTRYGAMYRESSIINSSMIGNLFYQFKCQTNPSPHWIPGNAYGNEALHNHFTTLGTGGAYADSDAGVSLTTGDPNINTAVSESSDDWGRPNSGSPLIGRFATKVLVDINNVERGALSDVGALEYEEDAGAASGAKVVMILS